MTENSKSNKRGSNRIWIIPVVLIVLMALGVGTYFVLGYIDQQKAIAESIRIEESIQAELAEMERFLDRDTFYAGIFIDDLDLSDMTLPEAQDLLLAREKAMQEELAIQVFLDDEVMTLNAADIQLHNDWETVLEQAWQLGRDSEATEREEQIRERYAAVTALLETPRVFTLSKLFDESAIRKAVLDFAGSLNVLPADAEVTGFEVDARQFILTESVTGRTVDGEKTAEAVISRLKRNSPVAMTFPLLSTTIEPEMGSATLKSQLGMISEAVTIAYNNPNRNNNINLICRALNGMVLQPGEMFSFNGRIGRRTEAKGYLEAGGIINGILVDTFGGGICQPSTTLCHAVLKADLQIDERHPHSWPSSYTDPGLDATVSWNGPDFKFTNNTDYPIAIVAWFNNPRVNFRIYGQLFEEGVSIRLDTKVTEVMPVTNPPTERFDPELRPGERVELRPPYTGKKVTAYKVWVKNGEVIDREVAFYSTYQPLNQIIGYGPSPTPSPSPTPVEDPEPSPETPADPDPEQSPEPPADPDPGEG